MAQPEAERIFRMLLDYSKVRSESRCYDVSLILEGFEKEVLTKYCAESPLARKWSAMIKEYRAVDPREQSKLPGFY